MIKLNVFKIFIIFIIISISIFLLSACSLFEESKQYYEPNLDIEMEEIPDYDFEKTYDVIVVGTEPEGIAAAVSSARNGLNTLLIDERAEVGGLVVRGMLNTLDMNYDPEGEILSEGIFEEFYKQLEGTSFNTETAKNVFERMISEEKNLELMNSTEIIEPIIDKDRIVGLKVKKDDKKINYAAPRLIDATIDADIAAQAGVPYSVGLEDIFRENKFQVATLVFELENVNWKEAKDYLSQDGNGDSGGDDRSLWGFSEEMNKYESSNSDLDVRGLNVGRQEGDRVLINSLHIFNVNPLDEESVNKGREKAISELPDIVEHINEHIVGFEEAELSGYGDELYLREGRHTETKEKLTINDVRENRNFENKIALASYPVDIQRTSPHDNGYVYNNPDTYSIPFGSIVTKEVDNLFVVSKAAGYDPLAHGSARVVPTGMTVAQSAGAAVRLSLEEEVSLHEFAEKDDLINVLQQRLKKQGMLLDDFDYSFAGEDRWTLSGIRFVNSLGLLIGGYENEYGLDDKIEQEEFANKLTLTLKRYFDMEEVDLGNDTFVINNDFVTREDASRILLEVAEKDVKEGGLKQLSDEGIISNKTRERALEDDYLKKDVVYVLFKEFIEYAEREELF